MVKKIIIVLLSFWVISVKAQLSPYVIPNTDWINYFSQTSTLVSSPSAIDINSNVYTTGYYGLTTQSDLIALKYDSLGALTYSYSYSAGNFDVGNAIKVDAAGNAYIAGTSFTSTTKNDFMVIKLSPTGSVIWSKRIDGGFSRPDEANDIAVDASGFVYVTGKAQTTTTGYDIKTYKLNNTNGNVLWTHNYVGFSTLTDEGKGIVVTGNGSKVYVTGETRTSTTGSDLITICIDGSTGSSIWTQTTNGTANTNEYAKGIVLTGTNVAVCGEINNTTTGIDYTTIKYNGSSGSIIWQNNYDFSSSTNRATSLAKDSAGNIGVVGTALNGSTQEYHTLIYSSGGTLLQVNKESTGVATLNADPKICNDTIAHHWYVSGEAMNSSKDIFVYQITPTGNTSWRKYVDGQNLDTDVGTSIGVNGLGVVYVGARSKNSAAAYDYTTIKINQTPAYIPVNYNFVTDTFSFSNLFYTNTGEILDTAQNAAAKVLLYTKFTYPNQYILNDRVAFCELEKDSAAGHISDTLSRVDLVFNGSNKLTQPYPVNVQQTSSLNYFMTHTGSGGKVNVQGASHVIVPNIYPSIDLWYSSNSVGSKYYFVVKPGGDPSQIRMSVEGAVSSTITSNDLKINSSLGSWTLKKPDIYNVALNFTTMALSTPTVTGTNGWNNVGGNMYSFNTGTYSPSWPLVIEFDMGKLSSPPASSLNCMWSTYVGGGNNDAPREIKSNNANELFVVGYTTSNNFPPGSGTGVFQTQNAGGNDGYIEKYSKAGLRLWATYIGGPFTDQVKSIDFDASGDIYVIGETTSPLQTQAKASATNSLTQLGGQDGFIFQTNAQANTNKWLTYIGGIRTDRVDRCKFDPDGNFFIVGTTSSTNIAVVGSSPQYTQASTTPTNSTDGFIIRYNTSSQVTWRTYLAATDDYNSGSESDGLRDLDFNSNKDLYVVGFSSGTDYPNVSNGNSTNYFYNGSGLPDGVMSRFSNTGQIKYSSYFGGNGQDYFLALKIKNNKLFVTGQKDPLGSNFPVKNSGNWFYSTASSALADCIFMVYNTNDSLLHSTFLQANSNMIGQDIDADSTNRIYVSGITRSSIFPTALTQPSGAYVETFKGQSDYFLYALEEGNTNVVWATNVGGTGDEGFFNGLGGGYIDINNENTLHITGNTASSSVFPLFDGAGVPYFDPTLNGSFDASVTRFYLYPVNGVDKISEYVKGSSGIFVYPNPAQTSINIKLDGFRENSYFYIYNAIGQLVANGSLEKNETGIDISRLPSGLYLLEVKDNAHKGSTKFIKND